MRDSNAPIINGFDCSGLVSRYSLRCEQFFAERGDTARLLDGASQTDVFPRKIRLSWTLNSGSSQQFADFNAALDDSETINLVSVVAYDPTRDALCSGNFYITRPAFPFALSVNGDPISQAGAELILDQQGALDWISVTPPIKLAYDFGDAFDSSGFRVTLTDDKDSVADITSECSLISGGASLSDGDLLTDAGNFPVSVTYRNAQIGAFAVSVAAAEIIASGSWWTLWSSGFLDIYCKGRMPYQGEQNWKGNSKQIKSVVIRDSVTTIRESAFSGCSNLASVTIPDSVTEIGENAFRGCSSLASVDIPDSVAFIGGFAFMNCENLESVTISKSVTTIREYAFSGCSNLASVTIPDSVTEIVTSAFSDCTNLISVTIPDSVTQIGSSAFSKCTNLANITIPDSVTSIGGSAFYLCKSLTSVDIPASVTSIGDYAFRGCSSLASVTIPDSVTSIGYQSFYGCASLTSVDIKDGVKSIREGAFSPCTSLASVTIPASVTSIGKYAFLFTALTSVTISRDCVVASTAFPSGCVISYYEDEEAGT